MPLTTAAPVHTASCSKIIPNSQRPYPCRWSRSSTDKAGLAKELAAHEKLHDISVGDIIRISAFGATGKVTYLHYDQDRLGYDVWPLQPEMCFSCTSCGEHPTGRNRSGQTAISTATKVKPNA